MSLRASGLERKTLWLAPEQIANQSVPDVVELMNDYRRLLLRARPIEGDDANYKAIVVVFTDLSADRAREYFDDVQIQHLKRLSYVEDGVVLGEFHERNEGAAIRNPSFRPFKSPVPFLLMRHAVVERLDVLPGQRRVAQLLGASLWRVRSPGSC